MPTPAQRIAILRRPGGGAGQLITFDPAKMGGVLYLDGTKLVVGNASSAWNSVLATIPAGAGRRYFECVGAGNDNNLSYVGFGCGNASTLLSNHLGNTTESIGSFSSGDVWDRGTSGASGLGGINPGDIMRGVIDRALGAFWPGKNGAFVGDPVSGTGGYTLPSGPIFAAANSYTQSGPVNVTINFGASPFAYPVPPGCVPYNAT